MIPRENGFALKDSEVVLKINLQLYSILREHLPKENGGKAEWQLADEITLADLLERLCIKRKVVISVNDIHETDFSRILKDGDNVKIFSSVSGG
jgi:molybdopterin converting factor small subunit